MSKNTATNLTGKVLLAMPSMTDQRFARSVIFMCAHDENGAMGLVINAPHPALEFENILEQLEIEEDNICDEAQNSVHIMEGGPVDSVRGYLLHSSDFSHEDTMRIDDQFSVTGTIDALKEVAYGNGPKDKIFMLGHASWHAGQLETELGSNSWLVAQASAELIFNTPHNDKWMDAMNGLGINPAMISSVSGRA